MSCLKARLREKPSKLLSQKSVHWLQHYHAQSPLSDDASLACCCEWLSMWECVKAEWGGWRETKQMGEHWLWPHSEEICVVNVLVFVSECSIQTWFQSLFLSPLSHPNRVPLPGHEGGGEWGSGVNPGSRIYDGKPHCLPERPLIWGCGH